MFRHVEGMANFKNAYRIINGKPERKRLLVRITSR
jgi:hypothetical protein